jgi:hypothetical protein
MSEYCTERAHVEGMYCREQVEALVATMGFKNQPGPGPCSEALLVYSWCTVGKKGNKQRGVGQAVPEENVVLIFLVSWACFFDKVYEVSYNFFFFAKCCLCYMSIKGQI